MHFGKQLLRKRYEPWSSNYLDYNSLKTVLERPIISEENEDDDTDKEKQKEDGGGGGMLTLLGGGGGGGDHHSRHSRHSRHRRRRPVSSSFLILLQSEIERVVHFFLQQQGILSSQLLSTRTRVDSLIQGGGEGLDDEGVLVITEELYSELYHNYHEIGRQLLYLVHFVNLNVTGLRKILKKHDKLTGDNLSNIYLGHSGVGRRGRGIGGNHIYNQLLFTSSSSLKKKTSKEEEEEDGQLLLPFQPAIVRPLLEDGGLEALYSTLQMSFLQLTSLRPSKLLLGNTKATTKSASLDRWNTWNDGDSNDDRPHGNGDGTSSPPPSSSSFTYGTISKSDRFAYNNDKTTNHLLYSSHIVMLLQIQAARSNLQESSNFIKMLAASTLLLDGGLPSEEDEGVEDDEDQQSLLLLDTADMTTSTRRQQQQRQISNYLNFCSTFLHMTDYYIIAPTSGMYSERLGQGAELAGLIIGLNSVAALVSTILYSWWTSYSYKSALVFATSCQLIGCFIYAMALPMNNIWWIIVGRLIGGFGSARSINRRYIADTYPISSRTAASAGFVTAGALGTSTGPAIASLLYLVVPTEEEGVLQNSDEEEKEEDAAKVGENLYWQIENAPGWTMGILWTIYIICLLFYFVEPPRKRQQIRRHVKMKKVDDETQSLLKKNGKEENEEEDQQQKPNDGTKVKHYHTSDDDSQQQPLWTVIPVVTTFFVYFTLKFILESLLSSTAILTDFYFEWGGNISGIYIAILGLLVLPANWMISVASQRHDDRDLILTCAGFMCLGCLTIMNWNVTTSSSYSAIHYVIGSVLIFVSANALEGPNMSLLSKTIPSRYRLGLFNVGLLATEAGTLGRAVGDVILTLCGSNGLGHILNTAFGAMSALSAATITMCLFVYDTLEPQEKDD